MKTVASMLVLSSLCATQAFAQIETPPAANSSPIEFNGYLDFYYQGSAQAHAAVTTPAPTAGPRVLEGRAFDRVSDQLTLNMVELSAKKKVGKVAFRIDAAFGEMVDVLTNSGPTAGAMGTNSTNPAAGEPTRNVTQTTIVYTPIDNLSITAGKFYTHMGYELTKAKDNWQYSRSYTFNYGLPFWHQGVGVSYAIIPSRLATSIYLLNAWDGRLSVETNQTPTLGVNINFVPLESLTVNYNYIGDPQAGSGNGRRDAHELNAVFVLNPKLSLAADFLLASQKKVSGGADAKWSSVSVYAKAQILSGYTLSPRYEIYDDSDGGFSTTVKQKLSSITVSNNFDLSDGLEARAEFRSDKSDSNAYFKTSDGGLSDRQDSYTFALLYNF